MRGAIRAQLTERFPNGSDANCWNLAPRKWNNRFRSTAVSGGLSVVPGKRYVAIFDQVIHERAYLER